MRSLIILLCFLSFTSLASPQIYPSTVEYRGTGTMMAKITLFGVSEKTPVEVVYVKDLSQEESSDIRLGSFMLMKGGDVTTVIRLNITAQKTFWICVKSSDNGFPIRNCATFKPKE